MSKLKAKNFEPQRRPSISIPTKSCRIPDTGAGRYMSNAIQTKRSEQDSNADISVFNT